MRTTIQLSDEHKTTLQALAAARGEKSLSRVVEEAVAFYLAEKDKPALVPVPLPLPTPAPVVELPPTGRWERLGGFIDRTIDRTWRQRTTLMGRVLGMVRARIGRSPAGA
jgi:hypothetical protein